MHTLNSSTQAAEAGRFLRLRPALSIEEVPGLGLHKETLCVFVGGGVYLLIFSKYKQVLKDRL